MWIQVVQVKQNLFRVGLNMVQGLSTSMVLRCHRAPCLLLCWTLEVVNRRMSMCYTIEYKGLHLFLHFRIYLTI